MCWSFSFDKEEVEVEPLSFLPQDEEDTDDVSWNVYTFVLKFVEPGHYTVNKSLMYEQ